MYNLFIKNTLRARISTFVFQWCTVDKAYKSDGGYKPDETPVVRHTSACATFPLFCLCCLFGNYLPFIMSPKRKADSSKGFHYCYKN